MSEENRKTEEKDMISEKDLITDETIEKAAGGDGGDMPPMPPINNGPIVCHRCGARFSRLKDYSRHIRNCN